MGDDDGASLLFQKDVVDLKRKGVGLLRETSIPSRSVLAGGEARQRGRASLVEIGGQLSANGRVDLVTRERRNAWADAAVHEDHAVDLDGCVECPQPFAVGSIAAEPDQHLDLSEGRVLEELVGIGTLG